jgi:hypothetical protein
MAAGGTTGGRTVGEFLGYTFVYTDLLPVLDPSSHRMLMVDNPPTAAFGA